MTQCIIEIKKQAGIPFPEGILRTTVKPVFVLFFTCGFKEGRRAAGWLTTSRDKYIVAAWLLAKIPLLLKNFLIYLHGISSKFLQDSWFKALFHALWKCPHFGGNNEYFLSVIVCSCLYMHKKSPHFLICI